MIVLYDHHLQLNSAARSLKRHYSYLGGLSRVAVTDFVQAANGGGLFELPGIPAVDVAWEAIGDRGRKKQFEYLGDRLLEFCANEEVGNGGVITVYGGSTFADRLNGLHFPWPIYDLRGISSRFELEQWYDLLFGAPRSEETRTSDIAELYKLSRVRLDEPSQTEVFDALEHISTVSSIGITNVADAYAATLPVAQEHKQALILLDYLAQPLRYRQKMMSAVLARTHNVDTVLGSLKRATRRGLRFRLRHGHKSRRGTYAIAQNNDRLLLWIVALAEASDRALTGEAKIWVAPDRRAVSVDGICSLFESKVLNRGRVEVGGKPLSIATCGSSFWVDDGKLILEWMKKCSFMLPANYRQAVVSWLLNEQNGDGAPERLFGGPATLVATARNPAVEQVVARIVHKVAPLKPVLLVGSDSDCMTVAHLASTRFLCEGVRQPSDQPCGACAGCLAPDFGRSATNLDWAYSEAIAWLDEQITYQGFLGARAITLRNVDQVAPSEVEPFLKRFEGLNNTNLIVITARNFGNLPAALASRCLPVLL